MNNLRNRRNFIRNSIFGITGLSCGTTAIAKAYFSMDEPFEGYNPFSEETTDLRQSKFYGDDLVVKGTLFNKTSHQALEFAQIEVWHLSPNSNKYRNRGKFMTDANGRYKFITQIPSKELGKPRKVFFKITLKNKSYYTQLIIGDNGAYITGEHWEHHLKDFPEFSKVNKTSFVTFDFLV